MDSTPQLKKTHRLTEHLQKQVPSFCIQEKYLIKGRHYLRIKSWEKIFQANGPKKQTDVVNLISNKINFKPKSIKKKWGRIPHTHQRKNLPE